MLSQNSWLKITLVSVNANLMNPFMKTITVPSVRYGATSASCVVWARLAVGRSECRAGTTSLKQQMAVFPNLNLHQAPTANENCYKQLDDSLHFSTFYTLMTHFS